MSHDLIRLIASDNSKLHKQDVIRNEALNGNDDFFKGLLYALDNRTTFGVKNVPVKAEDSSGPGLDFEIFCKLAENLKHRRLTGHAAQAEIQSYMDMATVNEWNGWYRLILTKDFRAGFSESTVNKAVKVANPSYIIPTTPYMRCSLPEGSNIEDFDWELGVYSNIKHDGMFANVNVSSDGDVWVTSRSGSLFPDGVLGIEADASKVLKRNTQSHGELTVYDDGVLQERQVGNGILNSVLKGGTLGLGITVRFDVWDQIPLDEVVPKGKYEVEYEFRFTNLCNQVEPTIDTQDSIRIGEWKIVHSPEEAEAHYKEVRKRKLEGTIVKSRATFWKDGTSKDQVKFKESVDVEVRVVGFEPGKGKNKATFGSLTCESEDGIMQCGASGLSDDLRKYIHEHREEYLGSVITIRANGIMYSTKAGKKHSLYLTRFVEKREDKEVADTFAQIEAQFAAAISTEVIEVPLED